MPEEDVIAKSQQMWTQAGLAQELRLLGLRAGDVVLMHCALGQLGWVLGGAPTVIAAVIDVLGPSGTVCMPGHTGHLSDPAHWQNPPVPQEWHDQIRRDMPVFDPETTPPRGIGAVAHVFWRWPGTKRSFHPQVSMMAWGARAVEITHRHPLDNAMGPDSPLGRIAGLAGRILMLGTDYSACTALHLVEYRVPRPEEQIAMPIARQGSATQWYDAQEPATLHARFPEIGRAYEADGAAGIRFGMSGRARLIEIADLVDFAQRYVTTHPET